MIDILTIAEVHRRYPIPLGTLRYWRHRGTGPKSFKVGRRVMYRKADVDAWIESQYNSHETRAVPDARATGRDPTGAAAVRNMQPARRTA